MPSFSTKSLETTSSPYINRFLQPDTIIPYPTNPQSLNRFTYALNNPIRYADPSGHMVSEDDGGGTLGNTLKYFKKYGKHKDKFNDYYATIYNAELALAEVVSGGITESELKVLGAFDAAIQLEHDRAVNSLSQNSFSQSMLSSTRTPLALQGTQMGFDLLPEITNPDKKNEILMASGLLLYYSSSLIKTDAFHNFPTSFDDYIINNGAITINTGEYTQANMDGYVNGVSGQYEIGWQTMPDGSYVITHRFFRPSPPLQVDLEK